MTERKVKLDRANKSILLRALGNVYYAQKATGSDCTCLLYTSDAADEL